MAGMLAFGLSDSICGAYWATSLPANGCPSSQIAIAKPAVVPLWKVMVGPRADNCYRTRKGPVFLCAGSGLVPHEIQLRGTTT
jgi:hypothetical protein